MLPVWLRNVDNVLLLHARCGTAACRMNVWCGATSQCIAGAVLCWPSTQLWQQQQEHDQEQGTAASGLYAYRYLQTWQVLLCVFSARAWIPTGRAAFSAAAPQVNMHEGCHQGAHMRLVCGYARGFLLPLLQACGGVQAEPLQLHEQVTASAWHWSGMP